MGKDDRVLRAQTRADPLPSQNLLPSLNQSLLRVVAALREDDAEAEERVAVAREQVQGPAERRLGVREVRRGVGRLGPGGVRLAEVLEARRAFRAPAAAGAGGAPVTVYTLVLPHASALADGGAGLRKTYV